MKHPTKIMKRFHHATLSCCLMLLLFINPLQSSADSAEYKLKAALLYKLTKFVEWPSIKDEPQDRLFGLCILGENPFASSLDALEQHKVADRKISVHYYDHSDEIIGNCDLVFISNSKRPFLRTILGKLTNQSILSVGDSDDFAERGGIIQFTSGKRIGFKINIESANRSGLKIAAPLLQLATIVGSMDK